MHRENRTMKILLAALLGVPLTLPALDYKPEFIMTEIEGGFRISEIMLKDGTARVIYCPPAGWNAGEDERCLRFHPPGISLADLTIESEKKTAARTLDAAAAERCRAWLKASIPGDSSDVEMEPDEANPGRVANCPTFGTTIAYSRGGFRYRKRVVFVFAPDSELRFTTVARIGDFDRLYPAVRRSLFTWRWEREK
jgi:hypothetical protein